MFGIKVALKIFFASFGSFIKLDNSYEKEYDMHMARIQLLLPIQSSLSPLLFAQIDKLSFPINIINEIPVNTLSGEELLEDSEESNFTWSDGVQDLKQNSSATDSICGHIGKDG